MGSSTERSDSNGLTGVRTLVAIALALLATILLAGCGESRATATPDAVQTSSGLATQTALILPLRPTPVPAVTVTATTRAAADYSDGELAAIAQSLADEFYGTDLASSDFATASDSFSSFCQPGSASELAESRARAWQDALSAEVVAVERLANHGMLVFTLLSAQGTTPITEAHLVVYEGGRWVNNDCDEGRAAVAFSLRLVPSDEDAATEDSFPSLSLPRFPQLTGTPAEHSDELIARSAEASLTARIAAELAVPHPDLGALRALGAAECQSLADEELADLASHARSTIGRVSYSFRYHVNAVQRIDENRAWVSTIEIADGRPREQAPPLLFTFWKGQWRMADCPNARRAWPTPPETVPEILRVGLAGEPVQIQYRYFEAPYAVTVLGEPQQAGEGMLRLPVRYTSIVGKWSYESATFVPTRMGFSDTNGELSFWKGVDCPQDAERDGHFAKGGWIDTHICFAPAETPEVQWEDGLQRPDSWIEFNVDWLGGSPLERPVYIDLTQQAALAPPARFENGLPTGPVDGIDERLGFISWPIPDEVPLREYGDPVVVWGAYYSNSRETAALSGVEAFSPDMVRLRASITNKGLLFGTADRTGVVLTGFPDENGRIHDVWRAVYEDESGSALPDSFAGVDIERGESHEAYLYFRAPDGVTVPSDSMDAILWVPDINGDYTPIYLDRA